MDAFAALAEPMRRRVLQELRRAPRTVNDLASALGAAQPTMSKCLKALHTAGFVSRRADGTRRIYQLEPAPFRAMDAWLSPYLALWERHLDLLERHLDREEKKHEERIGKPKPARRRPRRARRP